MKENNIKMKDHCLSFYRDDTVDNGVAIARMYDAAFCYEDSTVERLYGIDKKSWVEGGRWSAEGCAFWGQYIAETVTKGLWQPADKKGYEYAVIPGANDQALVLFRPANLNITKRVSEYFWERMGNLLNNKELLAAHKAKNARERGD